MFTKQCARCGAAYGSGEWRLLPYVGPMQDGQGTVVQLRNCACGTTLAVAVAQPPADFAKLPSTIPPPPSGDAR